MSRERVPEALQRRIEDDLAPVRPLPPAWRRALVVAAVAIGVFAVMMALTPLRSDMESIPMWLGWGGSALQLLLGVLLLGLALREGVPGHGTPAGVAVAAVTVAVATQILVGVATWAVAPADPAGDAFVECGVRCIGHDAVLALPPLVVTLWLLWRALPLRPEIAGLLGGGGAALVADAVNHLLCPVSSLRHVLVWHSGAVFLFLALGWFGGRAWQRVRAR